MKKRILLFIMVISLTTVMTIYPGSAFAEDSVGSPSEIEEPSPEETQVPSEEIDTTEDGDEGSEDGRTEDPEDGAEGSEKTGSGRRS